MTETKSETPMPKRGGWLRKLVWIAGTLVILLIVAWFVVTSSAFVKGVVLPKVGAAVNAEVTASDVSLSPFSQIVIRDLKVTPKGAEPLLTAGEVRARYSLMAILRGNIAVEEVAISNPTVTLVQNVDGTSNLDPILKSQKSVEKKETKPAGVASAHLNLDIKSVKFNNATLRQTRKYLDGKRDVIEVSSLNVTLSDLKNGLPGKLDFNTVLAVDQSARTNMAAAILSGTLGGGLTFNLSNALMPTALKGNVTLTVSKAIGLFADADGLLVTFATEASPSEIKQLAVRFSKAAESLGELRVSGPFDAAKLEGKLKVELTGVDKKLLNVAGAAAGLDFGSTAVGLTSSVELSKAGAQIAASGQANLSKFQVTRQGQTTPTLDLRCDYSVTVDSAAKSAVLKTLDLAGTQGQRPLLQAALTAPMTIAWGNTANAVGDSALNLSVNALDLADWKPFIGTIAPAGKVDLTAKLLSQQAGKQLQFEAKAGVAGLTVVAATNRFTGLGVNVEARGQATDLKQFRLASYSARLAQNGQQLLAADGSGTYDLATQAADAGAKVTVELPVVARTVALPDISLTAGSLQMQTQLKHRTNSDAINGKLALAGISGSFATTRLTDFGLETDVDVAKLGDKVQILKATGKLTNANQPGGEFDATGSYNLATKAGDVTAKLAGINQAALAPFLASALGDKKLVSVAINSTVAANVAANGDASVKTDLQVTNLVVNDPKGTLPATPLEARVQADASVAKQVAQLRQLQLTLTPTDSAKNQLGLTGTVDFSKSNAITGSLKLAAESLDVTRYYDLFSGKDKTGAAKSSPTPSSSAADPNKEPDAVNLPFRNFTFDASIGRFHLREMAITNLLATAKLDGGHIVVKPCQLNLNGAPVSATVDADLGVPGFKYDVAFNADKVPLAPLANSFVPERKGQFAGVTSVGAQVKGAGVTGASLQKNLSGQFSILSTNLDLSIANVRSSWLKGIVNAIVVIPDIIRGIENPLSAGLSFINTVAGRGQATNGWVDQLTASPISVIDLHGTAANGRVDLQTAEVRSAAFQATATGGIELNRVLTNSTLSFPVKVSLSREMADKIGLVSAGTPTNQTYLALPDFLKMKGTLGDAKPDINKLALAGIAVKSGAGVVKNIGVAGTEKVTSVIGAVGNLIGVGPSPTTSGATNAAGTNQPQPVNLLDLFSKPKK